jgi:hypothetical protein
VAQYCCTLPLLRFIEIFIEILLRFIAILSDHSIFEIRTGKEYSEMEMEVEIEGRGDGDGDRGEGRWR